MMIEFLRHLIETEDGMILYLLAGIAIAMIIDFILGTIAAKVNKNIKFESQKGINGILRKISSMIVMIFFIPISVLIPAKIGGSLLYVLYFGYLLMEIKSILENLNKMGINIDLFNRFLNEIESNSENKK